MHNRQNASFLAIIAALTMSLIACMGTIKTLVPTNPASTKSPQQLTTTIEATATGSVPESTVVVTPEATQLPPQAGKIDITAINGFKDEGDYWYFSGLVRNNTQETITDVQIGLSLLDSAGTEVYTYTTYTILSYLLPGESSPFTDFTTDPFPNGQTIQAVVIDSGSVDAIKRATIEFHGVTLWADEYNDVYLAGDVYNPGNEPVEVNGIAGTLADTSGNLVTASSPYPYLSYIEPNSSSPMVMMFDAPIGTAQTLTDYSLYSDAVTTNPTSKYDIKISDQHNRYQDTNGDTHLVGSVTNNYSEPLNIYLVAGLYDKDGNCIDANVVYLPKPLNPGETYPYDFSLWGAVDYVPDAYATITEYKVYVDWLATYESSPGTVSLSTQNDNQEYSDGTGHFTGSVINNTGQDLTTAMVSVSLYDKTSGNLIATNMNFVPEIMYKDATGTYDIYVYPPVDIDPANVDVVITATGQ